MISWRDLYRLVSYARASLWVVPFFAIATEMLVSRFIQGLDARLGWTLLGLAVPGATSLYQTIITMTLSFMVFTFGSLLVAIQVASGQLTPRIIATTLLRDNTVRYTVGLFVFTLLYALRALDRMESTVQQFSVFTAALLGLFSLVMFLFLIDYAARLLRPASIVWRVGESGIAVLEGVHARDLGAAITRTDAPSPQALGEADAVVTHEGGSGTVLAVNYPALFELASSTGGTVELVPHVGDFLAVDEPLFRLYGDARALDPEPLREAVAVGPERTMEQDTTFSFRILCDIALKALSKAINDPTTAVLAIDQIHRLLRVAGERHLKHDQISDPAGRARVIVRTPNWEDYVHLACREIRIAGAENIQIPRRLRAMLENLVHALPERRHKALLEELDLLERSVQAAYRFPEDLALARTPDAQGMGGVTTLETEAGDAREPRRPELAKSA
ncbi:MAG TPA: DUF2254 domain-containing protein [Burkholderiales bacterium]|nr:DUF2254 domain-containing protein [Burkholderiales bacterium]